VSSAKPSARTRPREANRHTGREGHWHFPCWNGGAVSPEGPVWAFLPGSAWPRCRRCEGPVPLRGATPRSVNSGNSHGPCLIGGFPAVPPPGVEGAAGLLMDRRGCDSAARFWTDRPSLSCVRPLAGSRSRQGVVLASSCPPRPCAVTETPGCSIAHRSPTQSLSSRGGHSHAEESKDTCGRQPGRQAP
jgi:hypothetical protein